MIVYTYLGQDLMPNSLSWDCEGFFWTIIPRFDEEEEEEAIKEKKKKWIKRDIYLYICTQVQTSPFVFSW